MKTKKRTKAAETGAFKTAAAATAAADGVKTGAFCVTVDGKDWYVVERNRWYAVGKVLMELGGAVRRL